MKKTLFGIGAFLLGIYLLSLLYIGLHVFDSTAKRSDAIVVLGAASLFKNQLNPCLRERVKEGVALYKENYAPKIVMSGGIDHFGGKSQGERMADLAKSYGVPRDAIVIENKSKNTYENIAFVKELIGTKDIIIVSDPYHLPRASLIAKSLGMPSTVSPALHSPCWERYQFLGFDYLRDGLALIFYILTGKIRIFP